MVASRNAACNLNLFLLKNGSILRMSVCFISFRGSIGISPIMV